MAGKHRISITLDEDLVTRIDRIVDGYNIKNRSHAIEKILIKTLNEQSIKQAIILCGGKGQKLKPITYELPKPMIPVRDKPVLEYIIEHLRDEGVTDIILVVDYKHEKIISHFGKGRSLGVNIRYIIEDQPHGTGGFLRSAKDMVNDTFLLLYGDVLSKVDIHDMLKCHRANRALATMALTTTSDTASFGVAKLKGEKITGFVEKPSPGESPSNLINAGVFILEPELSGRVPAGASNKIMIESIFEEFAKQGKLAGYVYDGQWFHMNTPEIYEKAIKEWDINAVPENG
ncbi:MAG: sugar phosphate nucleotidyltransferase [archaeon]|nr:sugar phosphate nucleotidyltransferase [archaeon]